MAADNIFWHSSPKSEISIVLGYRVREADLGHTFLDKTRVVIPAVDLSCEPDFVFVSHDAISGGRVRFTPPAVPKTDSYLEVEGPPDMVLEVVSASSVAKDTQRLFQDFYVGGVREYWLVDARGDELSFQIYTRGPEQFVPAETDDDGYQRSDVFDTWYTFSRSRDQHDLWRYDLAEKA